MAIVLLLAAAACGDATSGGSSALTSGRADGSSPSRADVVAPTADPVRALPAAAPAPSHPPVRTHPALAAPVVVGTLGAVGGADVAPPGAPDPGAAPPPPAGPPPVVASTTGRSSGQVMLAVAGDVLAHDAVNDSARRAAGGVGHDYAPLLSGVAPVLSRADLALCHLEVPIAAPGQEIGGYPSFGAPAPLVDGIAAAGWDGCSLASNHSLDRGLDGVRRTIEEFDRVGLGHAGTAAAAAEDGRAARYVVDGVRVAHLSYAYGFNGLALPTPWAAEVIDPDRIAADARRARRRADVVVVSLHWGTEGVHAPTADQRAVAAALLPSDDIDLVVGHHAHVVQPIERIGRTWVLWGLGNHLSNQRLLDERDGLLAEVTLAPDGTGGWGGVGVRAVPTWVNVAGHRVLPATAAGGDVSASVRAELVASHARTAGVLDAGDVPGLAMAPAP